MILRPSSWLLVVWLLVAACTPGGREVQALVEDVSGTVDADVAARVLRHVDVVRAPITVTAGRDFERTYGVQDQVAFEQLVREQIGDLSGRSVRVSQQVVDERADDGAAVTLTLVLEGGGQPPRVVPVAMELQRVGGKLLVTQLRVML